MLVLYLSSNQMEEGLMVATKDDVQNFLDQFHAKMKIFDIIYRDDRGKNNKALEDLEIVPSGRSETIISI